MCSCYSTVHGCLRKGVAIVYLEEHNFNEDVGVMLGVNESFNIEGLESRLMLGLGMAATLSLVTMIVMLFAT